MTHFLLVCRIRFSVSGVQKQNEKKKEKKIKGKPQSYKRVKKQQ